VLLLLLLALLRWTGGGMGRGKAAARRRSGVPNQTLSLQAARTPHSDDYKQRVGR